MLLSRRRGVAEPPQLHSSATGGRQRLRAAGFLCHPLFLYDAKKKETKLAASSCAHLLLRGVCQPSQFASHYVSLLASFFGTGLTDLMHLNFSQQQNTFSVFSSRLGPSVGGFLAKLWVEVRGVGVVETLQLLSRPGTRHADRRESPVSSELRRQLESFPRRASQMLFLTVFSSLSFLSVLVSKSAARLKLPLLQAAPCRRSTAATSR